MTFPTIVQGAKDGEPLVFLSGFPDNHAVWTKSLAPMFESKYRSIIMCMPDYDSPKAKAHHGYSWPELDKMFAATMKKYVPEGRKPTIVAHDWGVVVAQRWLKNHDSEVAGFIALDVMLGPKHVPGCNGTKDLLHILYYQIFLAFVWVLGVIHPDLGNAALKLFAVMPAMSPDLDPPRASLVAPPYGPKAHMCYPYFYYYADMAKLGAKALMAKAMGSPSGKEKSEVSKSGGGGRRGIPIPNCPILYMYGTRKRAMFHCQDTLDQLEARDDASVKAFDCGHWVQHKKTAEVAALMREFLSKYVDGKSKGK